MMKLTKKGFTLIELLAVIVILAILVAVSIPAVTKYLTTARKGTYATNATTAIDAYRNYIVSNGITKDSSMTLEELNELLEKKLTTSSYGSAYEDFSTIYVTFDDNLIPTYSICLVDSKGNGVYTGSGESLVETNIKGDIVELAGNITSCSLNVSLLTPTTEAAFTFSGSTHTITDYNPAVGGTDVVIPSTIGGVTVTVLDANSFRDNGITSVIIPNGVTTIGNYAFLNGLLSKVNIPNSVTNIGVGAFKNNALTSATLTNNITTIGSQAFNNNLLTSITIPNQITTITSQAFDTNKLTSITLPDSVTAIKDYGFKNNLITEVNFGAGITEIGWGAFEANPLTHITIPSTVTTLGDRAFWGTQLTSVTIPNSVITIGGNAFRNNPLTSITFGTGLTSIGTQAFIGTQLTHVTIPSNVTAIGNYAFNKSSTSNSGLTTITNLTGRSFDWGLIVNTTTGYNFVTGTIVSSFGNVAVSAS